MDVDAAEADREEDDEAVDEEVDDAWASPEDLRQAWLAECRAVKTLEAQGRHAGSAALAAAREARDEAEATWRSAVGPKPVSIRMGRAQQRLDKAAKALERARLDLEEYVEETDRKCAEYRRRIEAAEERYKLRAEQLDELHAEAGELASVAAGAGTGRKTEGEVCGMVAAELQALAESLEEGSDAWGRVNLILAKVASTAGGGSPQQFDIGDEEDSKGGCGMAGRRCGGRGDGGAALWAEDPSGRWNRRATAAERGTSAGASGDGWQFPKKPFRQPGKGGHAQRDSPTGAASSGGPAAPAGGVPTSQGDNVDGDCGVAGVEAALAPPPVGGVLAPVAGGNSAVAVGDNAKGSGRTGKPRRRGDDEEANDPPHKSHRGEDEVVDASVELGGDDAARAQKLMQEQAVAMWAAKNAQSILGDETSRAIAGQLYAHKVQLVERRARDVGVDPKAEDGKSLVDLTPEEFTAWIQKVLEPAEKEASEAKEL